jgi:hypothetical protein|tara:strand:- start:3146 stop:6385 length:3240 start_codon:yes stop_codon:yes gene_type:complete
MEYSNNISTNIVRDAVDDTLIDFVATSNTKEIFNRIFVNNYSANKSFTLIGNYGTGKSTFLWALEKNLTREINYFSDISSDKNNVVDYEFIKLIGEKDSLQQSLSKTLKLRKDYSNAKILEALEKRRLKALGEKKGLVLVIDEFGKFLEYASKNNNTDELYLLQQISEWVNNDEYETYFIITLHQNFTSYGRNLSSQDKLEWEKIKGRFVDLVFNEPVEQLIFFASKKLEQFKIPVGLKTNFENLIEVIEQSKLVDFNKQTKDLSSALFPLDWLSTNVLVKSLQRYGQNERSLFSFLSDETKFSIKKLKDKEFYTVSNVYDYLINSLATEINSGENPHRTQWLTTLRALERAELVFEDDYSRAEEVIKTIGLVNLFSKAGGLFDEKFIINYFKLTRAFDVEVILQKLHASGITRFYKYSNKINFLEGTDLDLDEELISISKAVNPDFSVSFEIKNKINLPVLLAKRYSFITGTRRFFEYRVFDESEDLFDAKGVLDGYINLVFKDLKVEEVKKTSNDYPSNIFVLYKNAKEIRDEVFTILKYDKLIEKHKQDVNAIKLLNEELQFHVQNLENLVINNLFNNEKNIWIYSGENKKIQSKHRLYEFLTEVCHKIYEKTPVFNNELINKEFISTPVSTAKKNLIRALLKNDSIEDLGFPKDKFPPQKAIYISLLKETGIHKLNKKLGHYVLSTPGDKSPLFDIWCESEQFLKTASTKRYLSEFYEILGKTPLKLKKGFVDFFVPIFLIAKYQDFALFHKDTGFIPYFDSDTFEFIHKKPEDFYVLSYKLESSEEQLLECYIDLLGINDTIESKGALSLFFSIFMEFTKIQKALTNYAKNTKKGMTPKALALRAAILNAKDPKDALFSAFPEALGHTNISKINNPTTLEEFKKEISSTMRAISGSYQSLLNDIQIVVVNSFNCPTGLNFLDLRDSIQAKISSLDESKLILTQLQYYKALTRPFDDAKSWLDSVATALDYNLKELTDSDKPKLVAKIEELSISLIKACDINEYNKKSDAINGQAVKFGIYNQKGEFKDAIVYQKNSGSIKLKKIKKDINKTLSELSDSEKQSLLFELLKKEMNI